MKSSSSKRRTRPLRARASTVDSAEFEDYGPEPNMKLSHAFMLVLALHIIAVGGLFAFNKVKANHATASVKTENNLKKVMAGSEVTQSAPVAASLPLATAQASIPQTPAAPVAETVAVKSVSGGPGNAPTPPPAAPSPVVAAPAPQSSPSDTASATAPAVATTEYTIVKGDNPYKIAKRFHVSFDELMKMNNITDPRKIQIGQKLKIPAASVHKAKKH